MKTYFTIIFSLLVFFAIGNSSKEVKVITIDPVTYSIPGREFYIDSIIDLRLDTTNTGYSDMTWTGYYKKYNLNGGLGFSLKNLFDKSIPKKNDKQKPITILIKSFLLNDPGDNSRNASVAGMTAMFGLVGGLIYSAATSDQKKSYGYAGRHFEYHFILCENSVGGLRKIHEIKYGVSGELSFEKLIIEGIWEQLIYFNSKGMENYASADLNPKDLQFIGSQTSENIFTASEKVKGIYYAKSDFLFNQPEFNDSIVLREEKSSFSLINNISYQKIKEDVFGYCDGQDIYINVFYGSGIAEPRLIKVIGMGELLILNINKGLVVIDSKSGQWFKGTKSLLRTYVKNIPHLDKELQDLGDKVMGVDDLFQWFVRYNNERKFFWKKSIN